jgi:hypothetical protein
MRERADYVYVVYRATQYRVKSVAPNAKRQGNMTIKNASGNAVTPESQWPPDYFDSPNILELVIPCRPAKKDSQLAPAYKVMMRGDTVRFSWWECPRCFHRFRRRLSCCKHMGLITNIAGNCKAAR